MYNIAKNFNLVFRKENGIYSETDIVNYPYKVVHTELGIEIADFMTCKEVMQQKV